MANTFELISSVTVGSGGASSIDFTSIPSTFTDLCIKISSRVTAGGQDIINIAYNGSAASFTGRISFGAGSGTPASSTTYTQAAGVMEESTQTANIFANSELYIPNYAGSQYKSLSFDGVSENNATNALLIFGTSLWSNTSAITSISLTPYGGNNFAQYSTAYLYGVSNA